MSIYDVGLLEIARETKTKRKRSMGEYGKGWDGCVEVMRSKPN